MTSKQYRTAMGKMVDMGAIMLQNESTRAVGNMTVNARGDQVDSTNRVIDRKANQIKRQTQKVAAPNTPAPAPAPASTQHADMPIDPSDAFSDLPEDNDEVSTTAGGLAAAIAKTKSKT